MLKVEHHGVIIFSSFPLISITLPYYHYSDECYRLMRSLSKKTRALLKENVDALIRYWTKRELECHYPLFKSLVAPLIKNKRNELYKLKVQTKFPEDFDELKKFLLEYPKTEFSHLHLVIIDDSLEKANDVIDILKANSIISETMDDTYDKLL